MATLDIIFGNELTIDYGTKRGYGKRVDNKHCRKIQKFIRSEDFSRFCEENGMSADGNVVQISISHENPAYSLGDGRFIDSFLITRQGQGDGNFKTKRFLERPQNNEIQVFYTETYYVWKAAKERWAAFRLLNDEGQLSRQKVSQAVAELADFRKYQVLSKPEVVAKGLQKFWRVVCEAVSGKREIFVNFDNGKINDFEAGAFEVCTCNVGEGRLLKTRFNYFRNEGSGNFSRY